MRPLFLASLLLLTAVLRAAAQDAPPHRRLSGSSEMLRATPNMPNSKLGSKLAERSMKLPMPRPRDFGLDGVMPSASVAGSVSRRLFVSFTRRPHAFSLASRLRRMMLANSR